MTARAFALAMMNGSLEDEVIIPFIDGLCRSGYEGICLHPRDGLLTPYNSRRFWEKFDHIISLARERGMEVWFYDEFPYPSGAAGGIIPEDHPGARVRTLKFVEVDTKLNRAGLVDLGPETLVALLRYRVDENGKMQDLVDVTEDTGPYVDSWVWGEWHNRFYTGALRVREELHERGLADCYTIAYQPETPLGSDKLLAVQLVTAPGQKGGAGKPDITLPEVTDLFLETIYGRYSEIAAKQGLSHVPIFQDEVTFYCEFPWNREIQDRLEPIWGERMLLNLAALHSPTIEGWELLRYQYRQACQDAIEANWYERVARYCREHNLRMTGHLPGEESIIGSWPYLGDIFKNLGHFDVPGYDIITSYTTDDVNRCQAAGVKLVQSAAWLAGQKPTMAEVFGAHGFHLDMQKSRTIVAWLAAHDIVHLTDHGTWGCSLGMRKYDAPPVNNRFEPMDVGRPDMWGWQGWFADLLQNYAFDPEVLVLFPLESFARFRVSEQELWEEEVGLLETFFHYVCAHTQDNIFMPSYLLPEVEAVEDGFLLRGQHFKKLIVPPVRSMHAPTFTALEQFAEHPNFSWVLPQMEQTIGVFGEDIADDERRPIAARKIASCTEAQLLETKAAWFDELLGSRVSGLHSDVTIVKSLRRSRTDNSKSLLTIINPNESPVEVRCDQHPGQPIAQPPNGVAVEAERDGDGFLIRLAPRDIVLFEQTAGQESPSVESTEFIELNATSTAYRLIAPNHQSLKEGMASLEGYTDVPFRPVPASSLWKLDVPYAASDAVFADKFSMADLAQPLNFEVAFPVTLEANLQELLIAIDAESLPPEVAVLWDDAKLSASARDLYEQGNTVYGIPATLLTAGAHTIRFRSDITNAIHGVAERPILVGRFLVSSESPLTLAPMPSDWIEQSQPQSWPAIGMPEGYGPVEYRMTFDLPDASDNSSWDVVLPACIGVAEVEINGEPIGRSSWEPRLLTHKHGWQAGENSIVVRLYGSWNNVFSSLNRLSNGLTGEVILRGNKTNS